MQKPFPIIGMSPGNSYFKDEEIRYLLKTTMERFGRVGVLIADLPAIATYVALGYPENRARRDKAIPKGNALKNRVRKTMAELGYSEEQVKIFDWENAVEPDENYQQKYTAIRQLYKDNGKFHQLASATTRAVLEAAQNPPIQLDEATDIAVHYLLSELAFLEFAPAYLGVDKVVYVYHKNWRIYEDYIAGKLDGVVRPSLDFLLIENPYETYNPLWGLEEPNDGDYEDVLDRIQKTKVLRIGFSPYPPALVYDREAQTFSGLFYEIIVAIAKKHDWELRWTEEVGYGVIVDGLNENRFDLFGSTVWPTPERQLQAEFSRSLYQSPVFAWVRTGYGEMGPDARVAVKENDITDSIAQADFPQHRQVQVPQLAPATEVLKFVAEDRADFTFVEASLAEAFNKTSPVQLLATSQEPIRVYENAFMVKRGEKRLKEFWDGELASL